MVRGRKYFFKDISGGMNMKFVKLQILIAILYFSTTGCSYVSDMVEGELTTRASFSISAEQVGDDVIIRWDESNSSSNFAGIEIYRTVKPDDEFAGYETICDRWENSDLSFGVKGSYTHVNADKGVYFYRVGFIHWDEDEEDRNSENGYTGNEYTDYNSQTDIDEVSGSARVEIN